MPKRKRKEKDKKSIDAFFIRVKSLGDLVRYACSFSNAMSSVYAIREGKGFRLLSIGEKVGAANCVYYFDMERISKFIVYNPIGSKESIEMKESVSGGTPNFKEYRIQVLELANNPFTKAKKAGSIIPISVKEYNSLVTNALMRATGDEKFGTVYAFDYKGGRYLSIIEHVEGDGSAAMLFNRTGKSETFNFLKYDYQNGRMEQLCSMEDSLYNSLRVINLAEPFPFFKPE